MPSEVLFPLNTTGPAPSYREVVNAYRQVLAARYADGVYRPLVLPYHLYGGFLLMTYLCIPHTKHPLVYAARWPVLGVIVWFYWTLMLESTSQSAATAFAAGLCAAWGIMWSATWLVFYRPQWDAKRVQRRRRNDYSIGITQREKPGEPQKIGSAPLKQESEETTAIREDLGRENGDLRKRAMGNGHAKSEPNGHTDLNGNVNGRPKSSKGESPKYDDHMEYFWQPYPGNLAERIPWVVDLIMNFRGPGWNWAIPPLPDLPPHMKAKLGDPIEKDSSDAFSSVGLKPYPTRRELFYANVPHFILEYFMIDALKIIMMKDPYYVLGPNTYDLPPHLANLTTLQLRFVRQAITSAGVIVALQMAFALGPIIFCLILGPRILGLRGSAHYYPSFWGSFSNITDKGLNGLWGGWWHQTFRFAFSAPSNYLINNGYLKPRSMAAKLAALFFAFGISGFLHTGGSLSQVPKTYPLHAPIFFMLQALGIFIQTTIFSIFRPQLRALPKPVRQAGNFLFTACWLFWTGWWLVDDFSRGGIWLFEPIPFSLPRGLGFGVEGDSWWCWEHVGVGWYTGKHWWESGVAL